MYIFLQPIDPEKVQEVQGVQEASYEIKCHADPKSKQSPRKPKKVVVSSFLGFAWTSGGDSASIQARFLGLLGLLGLFATPAGRRRNKFCSGDVRC